jgi:hypothetical protein
LGNIDLKVNRRFTVVTVCNYGAYNDRHDADAPQMNFKCPSNELQMPLKCPSDELQLNTNKKIRREEVKKGRRKRKPTAAPAEVVVPASSVVDVDLSTSNGEFDDRDTPEVHLAIRRWLAYRRELVADETRKKKLKPYKEPEQAIKTELRKYETPKHFIASVDTSIGRGWEGIYPAKLPKPPHLAAGGTQGRRIGPDTGDLPIEDGSDQL